MIAALNGKLLESYGDEIVVDVGGVGYLVAVTKSVQNNLSGVGSPVKVIVYTDVKETSIALYGFGSPVEREVFLLLKKVKGIGSRMAMTILSNHGAEPLLTSIGQGDIQGLQNVPGVGKKTAERLIVELREQVRELVTDKTVRGHAAEIEISRSDPRLKDFPTVAQDVLLALEKLGFPNDRARSAVIHSMQSVGEGGDAGELLRIALINL